MTPAAVYEYEPTTEEKAVAARGFWIMLRPARAKLAKFNAKHAA